ERLGGTLRIARDARARTLVGRRTPNHDITRSRDRARRRHSACATPNRRLARWSGLGMSGPSERRIRIVVVDDHPVVREGLVAMLQTQPEFEVVGEAGSGADGLSMIEQFAPDVVLLDLELPGIDGVGVLRRLRENGTASRVIVFTVFDTDDRIISAVEAGAAGYLLKGAPRSDLFAAIRVVHSGGSLLQPLVAST